MMAQNTASDSRLLNLPQELIGNLFEFLPWRDLVACHMTCQSLNRISRESLVWRRLCVDGYNYWKGEGYLQSMLKAPPAAVKWKQLFAERKKQDIAIDQDMDSILNSQAGRINTMHHTILTGYDAKDSLLRHLNVPNNAQDVLSRQYWAAEILGSVERAEAIEEWINVAQGHSTSLERALGAFDLFVAVKAPLTLEDIPCHLDAIANRFKRSDVHNDFEAAMTADRARILSRWLHSQHYIGLEDDSAFRDLRNILLGIVLCEEDHASIPILSVAIFCFIAQRLGLNAHPCSYPGKVLAIVTIDETYPEGSNGRDKLYLDPHEGAGEFSLHRLKMQLSSWGVPAAQHDEFLQPASVKAMVLRIAANMKESVREHPEYVEVLTHPDPRALALQGIPDGRLATSLYPARAAYAIAWVALIFQERTQNNTVDVRIPLTRVAQHIQQNHRQDVHLLHHLTRIYAEVLDPTFIGSIREEILDNDRAPPLVQRRSELLQSERERLQYRVGQAMKHRRYGYYGAITGWDTECRAGAHWIMAMNVDGLPQGRHQPFYHVIVGGDETTRYVAQENIDVEDPEILEQVEGLDKIAGQFFKRWDSESKCFISNVTDQYPED